MKQTKKENISIARINNLDGYPIWDNICGYYILQLTFSETKTKVPMKLSLFLGNSDEIDAEQKCCVIREKFKKVHIFEGSRVIVLHNNRGIVKGVRVHGKPWFDVLNLKSSTLNKIIN